MKTIANIRTIKTRNFTVSVDALEDYDIDLSWDEDGTIRKGLENGTFINFCARVTVYCRGSKLAQDYLGGCIYKSVDEFQDHLGCKPGGYGSYFSDMIRTAVSEARKTLSDMRSVALRS